MKLCYKLTCNPWSDEGPIILADRIEHESGLIDKVEVNASEVTIHFHKAATPEQISGLLSNILCERQNQIIVPNSLSRTLSTMNRNVAITDSNGNRSTDLTIFIKAEDLPDLKKRGLTTVKAGENKIYRLSPTYPGMPADLRGVLSKADELATHIVEEANQETSKRSGTCALGDSLTQHLESLTQSLHIFANKHHNASTRGFSGGNGYFRAGATWRYVLALSATETHHPFFEARDQGTTLLMPSVDDFQLLRRLHRHFTQTGVLSDISRFDAATSATNIRDLYRPDLYSGLVSLLHCLRNPLMTTEYKDDLLDPSEFPRLTRWTTGQFKRATYVSFGTFHSIEADPRLFKYVEPLAFRNKERDIIFQPVRDVFNRIKWPETGVATRFSRALVESSGPAMKAALWEMYKNQASFGFYNQKGQPAIFRLFEAFINHFVKETYADMDKTLSSEVRAAAKVIGARVGKAFPRDITLLSRIYNIHDASELREAIKIALFRLEKAGVEQWKRSNIPEKEKLYPIKNEPFELLLDAITETSYREISDILSIFASLNAFNTNVGGKTDDSSNNQDTTYNETFEETLS
jgi:hypothetical protein